MTEREKIIDILNKNFTQEVECTPVYTAADGKKIELPQELCDIFNDIVTQAVIPYFADALIAAGLKFDRNISYTATLNLAQLERINDLERRLAATEHRAEVAERALLNACAELSDDIEKLQRCLYKAYIAEASQQLAEQKTESKDVSR